MPDKLIKLEIYQSELHKLLLSAISNYAPFPEIYKSMLSTNRCIKDIKKYIEDKNANNRTA